MAELGRKGFGKPKGFLVLEEHIEDSINQLNWNILSNNHVLAILRQSHNIDACRSLLLLQEEKDGLVPSFSCG